MGKGWFHRSAGQSSKGLLRQVQSPIGIDFGVGSLKLLQINPGDPPTLVAAACLETPEALVVDDAKRLSFQIEALPKLIKSGGFKGKRAVCAIPAGRTLCRQLELTTQDGVSMGDLVSAELPGAFGFDASQLVFRYYEINAGRGNKQGARGDVLCLAARREFVQQLMGAIKSAKLEPVGIHVEARAIVHAFDMVTRRAQDENTSLMYVDIGHGCTKVSIAHGRNLVFARTLKMCSRLIDEHVAHQLQVPLTQASRVRNQAAAVTLAAVGAGSDQTGTGEGAQEGSVATEAGAERVDRRVRDYPDGFVPVAGEGAVPDLSVSGSVGDRFVTACGEFEFDLTEPLEILVDDLMMCLRYHESRFEGRRPDRVVFVGGESLNVSMCQHVARKLRLPAQAADPLARVARTGKEPSLGVDISEPQPGWAVPMGLCLAPSDL